MIIKKYSCQRFAGIKDKSIVFNNGLNVLLGDNESGKSTLIEGVHAVMFKPSKVGKKTAEDKNFIYKFMPLSDGDSIDGELVISNGSGDYVLSKAWGEDPTAQLIMPDLATIKNEDKINELLKDIFMFKEGTYSNLLFAKQIHFREALERIMDNQETTSEVSSLFRKAIMELDGVSVNDLGSKIDDEINRLLKRWDVEKAYPEKNRGINNPYTSGIGEVVECFYNQERMRLTMSEVEDKEKHFEQISGQLKDLESKLATLKNEKDMMEKIEDDIINRSILEPHIAQYDKEREALMAINREWPKHELRLEQLVIQIADLAEEYKKLEMEKEKADKAKAKEGLCKIVAEADRLKNIVQQVQDEISALKNVTKEDVMQLEANQQEILEAEAKMKAGVMIGRLTYYSGDADLVITKDLDEPVIIKAGDTFRANGFIKLEAGQIFGLELKSGDIDFAELRSRHTRYKTELEALLLALGVDTIEAAKLNKEKLDDLKRDLHNYHKQIEVLLGDETYASLAEKIKAYDDLGQVMSIEAIESATKAINSRQIELLSEQRTLEGIVTKWREEYINIDELLEKIIKIKMDYQKDRDQLDRLAPLPVGYENADLFRSRLAELRETYETDRDKLSALKEEYYVSEQNLPESTYEEFAAEYKSLEMLFNRKLEQGKKLLKIKAAFETTREKIDEDSFAPIAEKFSDYVVQLTNNNFVAGDIDNSFNLKLAKDQRTDIPVNLLSTGTYDAVALALRLAILEYILGDVQGFMVLDDCLVDLDPHRKKEAVQLIQRFAAQHQVIFTTCSPETAELLGGNVIKMP